MKRRGYPVIIAVLLLVPLIPAIASATTITSTIILNSDLSSTEFNNISGTNVKILWPHPEWQQNGEDYFWISYADTGYPPNNDPPHAPWPVDAEIPGDPTAIFYESFVLPYDVNTGSIEVWADDTASVWIGRKGSSYPGYAWTLLQDANPIQSHYCANGAVGCIPSAGLSIDLSGLTAGSYELRFDTYQRFNGPFGLMYEGSITSQIPEVSSLLLSATGIGLICLIRRRRR